MIRKVINLYFSIFSILILLLIFIFIESASLHASESNTELDQYHATASEAKQNNSLKLLNIVSLNDREKEAVYQNLRENIQKPLHVWQLVVLDYPQLRLLRNEIFARHGFIFKSEDLDSYFRTFNWYTPNNNYSNSILSKTEKNNIEIIKRIEYLKYYKHREDAEQIQFSDKMGSHEDSVRTAYLPHINIEIDIVYTGCCGVISGYSSIKKDKQVLFSSEFGDEVDGNGNIEYYFTSWGRNLVAIISGEITGRKDNNSRNIMRDRIVIFDQSGHLYTELVLPFGDSMPGDLTNVVTITSNIVYLSGKTYNNKKFQKLLFLNKPIQFQPVIGNTYKWARADLADKDLDLECSSSNERIDIEPIFNPKRLWEITIKNANYRISPLVSSNLLIFSVNDPYEVRAIDKINGSVVWGYQMSDKIVSMDHDKNNLVVRTKNKLMLIELSSGNLIWENGFEHEKKEYIYKYSDILIKDKWIVESITIDGNTSPSPNVIIEDKRLQRDVIVNIYGIRTGDTIRSHRLSKHITLNKTARSIHIYDGYCLSIFDDILCYAKVDEYSYIRRNVSSNIHKLLFMSIGLSGQVKWHFDTQVKKWAPAEHLDNIYIYRCVPYIVEENRIRKVDTSLGRDSSSFEIRGPRNRLKIAMDRLVWSRYDLENSFKYTKYYDLSSSKPTANIDPSCFSKRIKGKYMYMTDFYPSHAVELSETCKSKLKNGYYANYGTIWRYYFPKKEYKGHPKIIHVDNNYILVKSRDKYVAIVEEALYDFLNR